MKAPPSSFHFTLNPFSVMPVHWAQQSFSTRLVLVAGTPGHNLYSCLPAHIKAVFLSSLTETPLSGCSGGSEHLWLETRDRRSRQTFLCISDMPPCLPSARQSDWHLLQRCWHDLVLGHVSRDLAKKRKCLFLHINTLFHNIKCP